MEGAWFWKAPIASLLQNIPSSFGQYARMVKKWTMERPGNARYHCHLLYRLLVLFLLIENMQIGSKHKYTMSLATFPGPHSASRRLQYRKADRENYANVVDM